MTTLIIALIVCGVICFLIGISILGNKSEYEMNKIFEGRNEKSNK